MQLSRLNASMWCLCFCLTGCAADNKKADDKAPAPTTPTNSLKALDSSEFPKTVTTTAGTLILHPPQFRSWEDFEVIEGIAVVETVPKDEQAPRFGILGFSANTAPDLDARTVGLDNITITSLEENGVEVDAARRELVEAALPLAAREVPLDLVLSYLADDVIPGSTPNIKSQPPRIIVDTTPAIIVLLQGEPVVAPIGESGIGFAANTNWSLFQVKASSKWYLRNNDDWLMATDLKGDWSWAQTLPKAIKELPDEDNWRSTKAAAIAWSEPSTPTAPTVYVDTQPAELILLTGKPELVEFGQSGLSYAANTDSQLFQYHARWYYLVSGRWFTNKTLDGKWAVVSELPNAFADIPEDHAKADVLAAVAGTPAAKMAVLDAQIPKKTDVPRDMRMPETVTYAGEPNFEPIEQTNLLRATNTSYSVIQVGTQFYLCYSGMWFLSNTPTGPWSLAETVPAALYTIPPSSPVYHTTYVKVYETSPVSVTYGYSSGYSGVYVVGGVPVYGTGWYYPPYYYYGGGYPIYYAYPYTYGSSSFYNPRTGAYGNVSRAYGPYGGYGYASGYNPSTGRYGRAESAWDHDEWYGRGEAYNPRTGRYAATERYYDADHGAWNTESIFQGNRGAIGVEREFDYNSGRADVITSRGGQGTFTRQQSGTGTNTASSVVTGGGRTITGSGRYENGDGQSTLSGSDGGTGTIERSAGSKGVVREGSFSKNGQTLDTTTTRSGSGPRTTFESSTGTQGAITGSGLNRSAIAKTDSGDLYAARDGNVYKKTSDGWSARSNDGWSAMDSRRGESNRQTRSFDGSEYRNRSGSSSTQRSRSTSSANRTGSLNRDYSARQRGMSRSSNYNRGSRARGQRSGGQFRGGGGRRR